MTEAEWLACDDPRPMLKFLGRGVSLRKLRLFFLACSDELWGTSTAGGIPIALEAVRQYGEDRVARGSAVIRVPAGEAIIDCSASEPFERSVQLREISTAGVIGRDISHHGSAYLETLLTRLACGGDWHVTADLLIIEQLKAGLALTRQAELFREVVRGPFRHLLFRAAWRWANGNTVEKLSRVIDDDLL
jgi:hypothetical protein